MQNKRLVEHNDLNFSEGNYILVEELKQLQSMNYALTNCQIKLLWLLCEDIAVCAIQNMVKTTLLAALAEK